jgi:hypothetical protein
MDRSYREPLINLKVGPKEKEVTLLVDSGAAQSSLTMHPPTLQVSLSFSPEWLSISRVKREEFNIPLFVYTQVKFQDKVM